MNAYWWTGGAGDTRGIRWKAWLCVPKKAGGIGFRRLRETNLALLGKQAWRLITRPNSLMTRIYKAKYYPHCSFFEAKEGSNPSFIWRSIMETQPFMADGSRRRIGNGQNTIIVTSILPGDLATLPVCALMDKTGSFWDKDSVIDLFNERDGKLILSLPLSMRKPSDAWTWAWEEKGNYSVRSCYKMLMGNLSSALDWNQIWQMDIPPKVVKNAWALAGLPVSNLTGNLAEWFLSNLKGLGADAGCKFSVILRSIWSARNDNIWNGKCSSVPTILNVASSFLTSWREARRTNMNTCQQGGQSEVRWSRPEIGRFKINTDGAINSEEGFTGLGWVVRDGTGDFIAAKSMKVSGTYRPVEAEALCIREALSWANKWVMILMILRRTRKKYFMRFFQTPLILLSVF